MQLVTPRTFSFKKRLAYYGVGVAAFVIAYSVGASIQITKDQASAMASQFAEETSGIGMIGLYLNNLQAALVMFIPGFGAGFGAYTGSSTGLLFAAIASTYELQGVSPLAVLATPFGVLEVLAYGLAMSRSGLLAYQLVKKKPWKEYLVPTGIEIAIVAVILLVAAISEAQVIAPA